MTTTITIARSALDYGQPTPQPARPGLVERLMVIATTFILVHPLPIHWFQSRSEFVDQDGAFLLLATQLTFMLIAIARVWGNLDWWLTAFRLDQSLFAFVALAFVSALWSADPIGTVRQAVMFGAVTLYAVYLVLRFPVAEILRLLAVVYVISTFVNLLWVVALPQFAIDNGLWDGVFFQKNSLGFAAMIGIPTLIVAGRTAARGRLVFYSTIPFLFALLLGSQSKTMLVSTIASVLLLFVYRTFRGRRTLRGAVILSLVTTSIFTAALATANITVLADWLDKDVSLTGRIPLWTDLLPLIAERPLQGWGYRAAFGGYFSPVHEVLVAADWAPTHAHNALLQIWLEMGIIGVILFLVTFIRAMTRGLQVVNLMPGIVGLWPLMFLSSTLLISITESGISYSRTGWMLYVVAALTAAQISRSPSARAQADGSNVADFRVGAGLEDIELRSRSNGA